MAENDEIPEATEDTDLDTESESNEESVEDVEESVADTEPAPDEVISVDGTGVDSNVAFPLSFNVIQQGVNDLLHQPLTEISEGVYSGSFTIENSDGIYNKDGLASIVVNIPNPCTHLVGQPCGRDELDNLNRMDLSFINDFNTGYEAFTSEINPGRVLQEHSSSSTDMISLKAPYDKDDPRFVFGNPKFFRVGFQDGDRKANVDF